jgi:hypothetical protein
VLETRRLLLEQGGFAGDTANTLQEFEARIVETQLPYGLYVLCHTLPVAERHAIAAAALKANTAVYQLVLVIRWCAIPDAWTRRAPMMWTLPRSALMMLIAPFLSRTGCING